MNFEIEQQENYTIINSRVEKLDTNVAPELKSHLVHLNGQGVKNMIINLNDSNYCDSSGLSAILVASRLCKGANGTFVLTNLQPMVEKLVNISQLHTVLNIIPTQAEAVDFIMMEEVERDLNDDA